MLAVGLNCEAAALEDPKLAASVLAGLSRAVPAGRRNRRAVIPQEDVETARLSDAVLDSIRRNQGALEFATLGSGNHFIEIQADEEDQLWLILHSGSGALGQAIRDHYLARAEAVGHGAPCTGRQQ
jgi:tRNA-splicing ligase RtcB (3'-phosphate/5'-hydroxy nucleic acid ligase)